MARAQQVLARLPPCASTGIGSLPHATGQRALMEDVPYLAQLPVGHPGEFMIPAALEGLPGLEVDAQGGTTVALDAWRAGREALAVALAEAPSAHFEPSPAACRSWAGFLEACGRHPVVKVQLAGPATVGWFTRAGDGRRVSEVPELAEQTRWLLERRALALVSAAQARGAEVMIFLDEAGLSGLPPGSGPSLEAVGELGARLRAAGAVTGLHCCGAADWPRIFELGFDVVSLDARRALDAALEDGGAWRRFREGGGTLALGVIPTEPGARYSVRELCESYEAALRATTPRFEETLARLLVTPACGLALHPVADAERILSEVRQVQRFFRALLG